MLFWFCVLLSSITQFPLFPGQNFVYQTNWRPQNKGSSPPRVCLCKQTTMSSPIFPGTEPWKHRSHHSFFLSSKPKCLSSCFASEISLSLLVSIFMKWVVFYEFIDSGGGGAHQTQVRTVPHRRVIMLSLSHGVIPSYTHIHMHPRTHAKTHSCVSHQQKIHTAWTSTHVTCIHITHIHTHKHTLAQRDTQVV